MKLCPPATVPHGGIGPLLSFGILEIHVALLCCASNDVSPTCVKKWTGIQDQDAIRILAAVSMQALRCLESV